MVTGKGSITYSYDAGGNKLSKMTVDNTVVPSKTTITTYIGGIVYQNDTLQFIAHEEGRARWALHKYLNGSTAMHLNMITSAGLAEDRYKDQ